MAMVAVVCPMADPPAVVRYQNRRVSDIANKIVDLFVAAEALMTAASNRFGFCASCGTQQQLDRVLQENNERTMQAHLETRYDIQMRGPYQSCPTTNSAQNMVPCANQYAGHAHLKQECTGLGNKDHKVEPDAKVKGVTAATGAACKERTMCLQSRLQPLDQRL